MWKPMLRMMPMRGMTASAGPMANSKRAERVGAARSRASAVAPPTGSIVSGTSVEASSAKSKEPHEVRKSRNEVVSFQNAATKYRQHICVRAAGRNVRSEPPRLKTTNVSSSTAAQHMWSHTIGIQTKKSAKLTMCAAKSIRCEGAAIARAMIGSRTAQST